MEGNATIEKDCTALGGLFQAVINDLRGSTPIWEDFTYKATKLHTSLKTTLVAIGAFLEAFQKVADMATNSRGATKDIGTALTRLCMRHRSIESKLKAFTGCIVDTLVNPVQDKLEDWKKAVAQLDKDHAKEYKKARQEIKKAASDTMRLQKKVKKGKSDLQSRLDSAMVEVNDKYLLLEESEKHCVRMALMEERHRYCHFVTSIKPFVNHELSLLTEITHIQEIMESLVTQCADPTTLPPASEQVIADIKGVDHSVWNFQQQSPPSSPSSLGSRKSSMCSISSINSSSSGSTKSHSPSHTLQPRSRTQQPMVGAVRLTSVSSQDSGFTSQDTLFLRPATPNSLSLLKSANQDRDGAGAETPDQDSTPTTPSDFASTPSANSTWNNWPNPPGGVPRPDSARPHTISSAYEKSHHARPALKADTFEPPSADAMEGTVEEREDRPTMRPPRAHSHHASGPYPRPPSATINRTQPVLPPLGPKPRPKAVPPPVVPTLAGPSPVYANTAELAKAMMGRTVQEEEEEQAQGQDSADDDGNTTPTMPANPSSLQSGPPSDSMHGRSHASLHSELMARLKSGQEDSEAELLDLQMAIRDLDSCTAALHLEYDGGAPPDSGPPMHPPSSKSHKTQQNSLELAAAIRELEASTAALQSTYDTASHTSRSSLQCSSGYGTMNSTPSGSEDTIASGDFHEFASVSAEVDHEKYNTIPRSADSMAAYRAVLGPKRPASTAGIPVSQSGGTLTRRSSVNTPKPPPPVRRTASISCSSGEGRRLRASPPKSPNGNGHIEGPYAELQLIQKSIHGQGGPQGPKPPGMANHAGVVGLGSGSNPYAIPTTQPGPSQPQASVVQSLNAKFAARQQQIEAGGHYQSHPGQPPPPAAGQGYPPQVPGHPPQVQGYPPQVQGYPPQVQGYPPQVQGYPPSVQGHLQQQQQQGQGYHPQGHFPQGHGHYYAQGQQGHGYAMGHGHPQVQGHPHSGPGVAGAGDGGEDFPLPPTEEELMAAMGGHPNASPPPPPPPSSQPPSARPPNLQDSLMMELRKRVTADDGSTV